MSRPRRARLEVSARTEPPPRAPKGLGPAGKRWWKRAWSDPAASLWGSGDVNLAERGAKLADACWNGNLAAEGPLIALERQLLLGPHAKRAGNVVVVPPGTGSPPRAPHSIGNELSAAREARRIAARERAGLST